MVLIVDDDEPSAKLMAILVRGEGYEARVAHSAEEALELVETWLPQLIVFDLVLPLMSGVTMAEKLKADPRTRDIVLVAVSAWNGDAAVRVAHDAGCLEYVRKPIDPLRFADDLERWMGDAR
jgi:CheY-like chemotaxis protein